MPVTIATTFGWCGWGITSDFPPAYKLGAFSIRFFADGLDQHVADLVNGERAHAQLNKQRDLERLRSQIRGH